MEQVLELPAAVLAFLAAAFGRVGIVLAVPVALALVTALLLGAARIVRRALRLGAGERSAGGIFWRRDRAYAPGHTWLQRRGRGIVRVGLDDLARRLFCDPAAVDLPRPGTRIEAGGTLAVLVCGRRRVEITSPVAGTVAAVNASLGVVPSRVRRSPYEGGWLVELGGVDELPDSVVEGARAGRWFDGERARLADWVRAELGDALVERGEVVVPPSAQLPDPQWSSLVASFLRAA